MAMYILLEYNQNYSMTSETLRNYYRDKIDDVDDNVSHGKSFKYKTKIVGRTPEKTSTTWKSRRCRSNTTTKSTNYKC